MTSNHGNELVIEAAEAVVRHVRWRFDQEKGLNPNEVDALARAFAVAAPHLPKPQPDRKYSGPLPS